MRYGLGPVYGYPMRSQTPFARLVETLLRQAGEIAGDATLNDWLRARRSGDKPTPWRDIAVEVQRVTGERPTDVTVSSWYEPDPEPAS